METTAGHGGNEPQERERHRFEDASLGYKFKLIQEQFRSMVNERMRAAELTFSQMGVLYYLDSSPGGRITQKMLCEAVHVKHPTMNGILSRMEEKGLVQQTVDPDNRRCRNIMLTEKGRRLMQMQNAERQACNEALTRGFTDEETGECHRLMNKIYRNLCGYREARQQENPRKTEKNERQEEQTL
ncbi:MarR family winged helix-turn-helix transcriptional regulator [Lachnoclostridium sp. Marseille-P6806]|uniref:MarR family winged helix-turn-helix transcriptional regulator n=1 Tax=Lachnoclostridium sp. Marseille-P6806 TaxID=2364793 RepID=UPI0013EF12D6|nr:MarR family transcriptional regulator [Lachnoclostridium sp. Marseille-P6806]